ncbi:MAG: MarR family transcriptional regulator [Bryobacteraceae bacterium]|jgi:DNA-binding MarR family transcriptional regulator
MRKQRDVHDLAQEIDSSLREIQRALRKPLSAAIARGELTAPQRAIMAILVRSDGLSLKELSRRAGLAHSTVSGIVDRLEKREMVTRQPDETDGRFSRIVVTEVVRDFVRDKLPELAIQPLVEALERASTAQRKKIAIGLRTLRAVLGEG